MSNNTTKIISLELINCKRLAAVTKIKRFKLELKETTQLILGTNGSGKSSILYELSPLPADKSNYYKGGKKIIVIEKGLSTFVLTSDFSKGGHHSFLCDDVELNPGGTVSVQKELVKDVFNLTVEIHEMILGLEKFTAMSPARRREWLTTLCTVDYNYALKLYKRMQENLRDTQGALKIAKKRLVSEMAVCLGEDELMQLRERQNALSQEAQSMYLIRNANTPSVFTSKSDLQNKVSEVDRLVSQFRAIRKSLREKSFLSPDEYQESIDQYRHDIATLDSRYASLSEEYMRLSNGNESNVEEIDGAELEHLRSEFVRLTAIVEQKNAERRTTFNITNAQNTLSAIDAVTAWVNQIVTDIPNNAEKKLSGARYAQVESDLQIVKARLVVVEQHHARLRHQLEHTEALSKNSELECPKCDHRFIMGYSKQAHQNLLASVEQEQKKLDAIKEEINSMEHEMEYLKSYRDNFRNFIKIKQTTPVLSDLWDYVTEHDLLDVSPQRISLLLTQLYEDATIVRHNEMTMEHADAIKRRIEMAEYAKSEIYKASKARCEALSDEISRVLGDKAMIERRLAAANRDKRDLLAMGEIRAKIDSALKQIESSNIQLIDALKNEIIDSSLARIHTELGEITTRINSADMQFGIVKDLQNQITEMELNEKAFKALVDSLSPVDGLIAEGMLGFIRHFVKLMNAVIARVWTYPMEVMDCSLDDEAVELSYKFPVLMGDMEDPVADISKGSSAMVEIVDLAFRVVASQCLGLDKGPLALDEFSKTFDDAHRESAIHVVQQLIEQLSYSQLFMISHYESTYGAFVDAQITVVNKLNVTVPGGRKYNQHTIIET